MSMTREEIINGLKFTVEMFLFNPSTGEIYTEPRNDMDKITIDACNEAIKLLEQDNKEIFKQFKKKVFLESEDVLGYEMVDSYMITDYLAELLEVVND